MASRPLGIVMNGVTGRMGYRQHLVRSLLAIREQGGVVARRRQPGLARSRSWSAAARTSSRDIAERHGLDATGPPTSTRRWPTPTSRSTSTPRSPGAGRRRCRKAIEAGKHVYTEKPTAETLDEALELARRPTTAGIKHGVVQDKLFLPGLLKLKRLIDGGFFGRILSVRGEFGYWVFEGDWQAAQRPSLELPGRGRRRHRRSTCSRTGTTCWRTCSARSSRVYAQAVTHIPQRWDEQGKRLRGHRRRRRVRDLRARRRRDRPDQLLLGGPGQPRRAGRVPGGRHARQRGRRAARLPRPAPRHHAQAGLEPRPARHRATSATSGRRCRTTRSSTTASRCSGSCSCATSSQDAPFPLGLRSPARAACSWPSWACSPRPRAAGSRCPEMRCDDIRLLDAGGDVTTSSCASR